MLENVLILAWLVETYLVIKEREMEMADSDKTSLGGSSWFRVWANPEMSGSREGVDYIDIISDTPERAVQDSDQYLPVGESDACRAVRMGSAEDYVVDGEQSRSLVVGGGGPDWDLDDVVELRPRSSD